MKILKRMLLIKWYYIEHEMIDLDASVNFMTGKNASGKSTIIDALQIVMLGDTRGTFFNKAANEKGGRTLDGYLRGEISDDGDTGFKSKRSGRFSSYIAVEFYDTVDRKYCTCGIVFDSYDSAPTDHMFFILNDKIPENEFVDTETNTPMDYKKLKAFFARNYAPNKYSTFKESNKSYQNEFLAKMGGLKPKFFNLFKKSVTFTPIDDIEKFISEYVCDVTNEIDIEKMKANIRQYKDLEKKAILMEERGKELENIENLYNSYKEAEANEKLQIYLYDKSSMKISEESFDKSQKQFESNKNEIERLREETKDLENRKSELKNIQKAKEAERNESYIYKKQDTIDKNIKEVTIKLDEANKKAEELIIRFRNKISKWRVNISQFINEKNNIDNQEIIQVAIKLKDNIEYLLSINEGNIESFDEEALNEIKEQMLKINGYANETFFEIQIEEKELFNDIQTLRKEIQDLKSGIKPYKTNLLEFKTELEKGLEEKFGEKVEAKILADLLEIKDLKWKDAIECYMNQQMFYFIIEPKYYNAASNIYRNLARSGKYEGFGIVDIENIKRINPNPEKNSLAEEIETENENARVYIDYLLGGVIKCEQTEELREYRTAITYDCMLYKNFVLRKIADKHNEFKFIGKKSIEEQIKLKEMALEENEQKINNMKNIKEITKELKDAEKFTDDEIKDRKEDMILIRRREEWEEQKKNFESERDSLDLTWLDKISKEIADLEIKISELENKRVSNAQAQGSKIEQNQRLQERDIPIFAEAINKKQQEIKNKFDAEWIQTYGEPRFEEEIKNKKAETINKIASQQKDKLEVQKNLEFDKVAKARTEYVRKYQFSYNTYVKDNNAEYSEELHKIREIQLPEYIDKIKDSKEKAYEQFREDFISKLKANIDEVESQVEELNDALKNSRFGADSYQFKVKPKQEYRRFYDMIKDNMLMEGYNLWSEAFNSKYGDEISELFKKLTSSEVQDETYNKNISIYTDYKTYLSFDLIVTDKEGITQHLSRTLDKKSGGETQTPFYISVLASFAQLYRINKNRNDNTLRLIVFDEAFNKMDEERMKESISLLPKFGFQAIIAAPSEKAGEIIPLVQNTLCVIRKGRNTVVRKWERERNFLG